MSQQEKKKHFLYYFFQADREQNPMPPKYAAALLQCLKRIFDEKYGGGNAK